MFLVIDAKMQMVDMPSSAENEKNQKYYGVLTGTHKMKTKNCVFVRVTANYSPGTNN